MVKRKSGLGKNNLNMLLSNTNLVKEKASPQENGETISKLPILNLKPGVYQPRRDIDEDTLKELSSSIKQQGLIQPIVVRKLENSQQYEIIAGERRWRASKLAGLKEVPAIIHDVDDKTCLAMALVENIQREELNPMDEARALQRLVDEFALTHLQAADIVSKSRAQVSNLLRLMHLHVDVQNMLENGDVEMGHARAILALDTALQADVARTVVAKELTVRETENLIKKMQKQVEVDFNLENPYLVEAKTQERRLSSKFGKGISVKANKQGKFKVVIQCENRDKLMKFVDEIA